jgi:hypothetical protein
MQRDCRLTPRSLKSGDLIPSGSLRCGPAEVASGHLGPGPHLAGDDEEASRQNQRRAERLPLPGAAMFMYISFSIVNMFLLRLNSQTQMMLGMCKQECSRVFVLQKHCINVSQISSLYLYHKCQVHCGSIERYCRTQHRHNDSTNHVALWYSLNTPVSQ